MIPWILLETASIPEGKEDLRLKRRGSEFSIMLGSVELMNSRVTGSERALASLSCEIIRDRRKPKILIGGLGMGFTLREALAQLNEDAEITVAEIVPAIVAWARGPLADVFGLCLTDPRTIIEETDVADVIEAGRTEYDAILLDVDNGPDGLTREANDGLYGEAGLHAAKRALTPGGVLAVWSSGPNGGFTRRLKRCGFEVREVKAHANSRRRSGARHVIWLASKPSR